MKRACAIPIVLLALLAGCATSAKEIPEPSAPVAVSAADVSAAHRVITIGASLPEDLRGGVTVEQWNDVPPASVDFAAARAALKNHVQALIDQLAASRSPAR
jgi:uncharacterized lipoprotein YmbA